MPTIWEMEARARELGQVLLDAIEDPESSVQGIIDHFVDAIHDALSTAYRDGVRAGMERMRERAATFAGIGTNSCEREHSEPIRAALAADPTPTACEGLALVEAAQAMRDWCDDVRKAGDCEYMSAKTEPGNQIFLALDAALAPWAARTPK